MDEREGKVQRALGLAEQCWQCHKYVPLGETLCYIKGPLYNSKGRLIRENVINRNRLCILCFNSKVIA